MKPDETAPEFDGAFAAKFETLLRWRRDVRHFRSEALPEPAVEELLRAASLAPSVGNSQPWRFVRVCNTDLRRNLAEHVDAEVAKAGGRYTATEQRDRYLSLKLHGIREAPELIAVFCDEQAEAGCGLGIATMPEMLRYSVVLAIHNLWMAARVRGIGVGWISILDPAHVARVIDVPVHWSLIAMLCLGYPEDESTTPELERRGWQAREAWQDRVFER